MNPRVMVLADLMQRTLQTHDLQHLGGILHEEGYDIATNRIQQLLDGAAPTPFELDTLKWMGLPVENTVEWALHYWPRNDESRPAPKD